MDREQIKNSKLIGKEVDRTSQDKLDEHDWCRTKRIRDTGVSEEKKASRNDLRNTPSKMKKDSRLIKQEKNKVG